MSRTRSDTRIERPGFGKGLWKEAKMGRHERRVHRQKGRVEEKRIFQKSKRRKTKKKKKEGDWELPWVTKSDP